MSDALQVLLVTLDAPPPDRALLLAPMAATVDAYFPGPVGPRVPLAEPGSVPGP